MKLNGKPGTAAGSTGPFKKELNQYGQKGRVAGPVVGAFAEMSSDTYAIADLVASVLAEVHCSYYSEVLCRFWVSRRTSAGRACWSTATVTWSRFPPRPASTPDDEDAYEHDKFFNPDTTPHSYD